MKDDYATIAKPDMRSMVALLSAALDDASFGALVSDDSFNIIFANKAAKAIFRNRGLGTVGSNLLVALGESVSTLDPESFRAALSKHGQYDGIVSIAVRQGRSRRVSVSCTRIEAEVGAETSAYVLTARQIGDLSEYDSRIVELDRMLTRGEMAGEIAHEMNNYLTILLGNLELIPLLLDRHDVDKAARKIPLMRKTVEKIAGFSESLVSYGKPRQSLEIVDLNRMLSDTIEFIKAQNRFDGIQVAVDLSSNIPPLIGDSGQLQQVVVNLMHNAADELRSSGRIGPLIRVTAGRSEDGNCTVVSVSDNGRGIPEEVGSELFKGRFTTKETGEGYGLLVCKKIIERHGGLISFCTEAGQGTRFEFRLPSSEEVAPHVDEPSVDNPSHGGGPPASM